VHGVGARSHAAVFLAFPADRFNFAGKGSVEKMKILNTNLQKGNFIHFLGFLHWFE
jgi:hypothetical protein